MIDTKKIKQKKVTHELLDVITKSLDTTETMYKGILKDTLKSRKVAKNAELENMDEDIVLTTHAENRYKERRLQKFENEYLDYIMELKEAQSYISEQLDKPIPKKSNTPSMGM